MNEPIQEKTPKPPGLLPKNVQSWLLIGLATFMVSIMWLTGAKKPQAAPKTTASAAAAQVPLDVNESKINEMQNRILDLQRQQLVAQNVLAQQTKLLGAMPPNAQTAQQPFTSGNPPQEHTEDPIKTERRKREYLSLFASNVALSYRKPSNSIQSSPESNANAIAPETPESAQLAQILKELQPIAPPQIATVPPASTQGASVEANKERKEEAQHAAAAPNRTPSAAAAKTYVLFEGTVLETVLINRLEGQFSGPVDCLLTTDVYSHDRQHLLIPAGTKLLGETHRVENSGQTRLAVVFHRLIMPDGYSVSLDQFRGLDQIGDTGLRDQVNNHYLRIFGVSLAIGALGAVGEAGTGGVLTQSGTDRIRQGFGQSTAQSSVQILDKFLNVLPTITIREGHRVKVYLSGDLALPEYNNHNLPSDL